MAVHRGFVAIRLFWQPRPSGGN